MDNQLQSGFLLNEWQVSPDQGILKLGEEIIHLEPRVMEVLVYLASRAGEVITREELERDVWRGAVVGYDAVTQMVTKLRKALNDDAKNPKYIATIPKRGYQLVARVSEVSSAVDASELLQDKPGNLHQKIVLAVSVLMVLVMGWYLSGTESTGTDSLLQEQVIADSKSTIVVLPFKNISNDPQQEYFSDGITDDLITDLSKVGSLHVIARQSAYHYKGSKLSVKNIAKDLAVQYVIEGSVQKSGSQLRINVQLTDAIKGHHVWAERFETGVEKLFSVQDEITQRVMNALYVKLSSDEDKHVAFRSTNNFDAYDMLLLGLQSSRNRTKEGYELAHDYFRQAINIDPNFARAYGALAVTLTNGYRHSWTKLSFEEARIRSLSMAKKAVELDQSTPQVYWALAYVHLFRKEYKEAEEATKQSIELSPNYADGYGLLAFISNWRGKAVEAEGYIKKAIKLNPYHTFDYPWNLGFSYYTQGKYEEAIEALQQAIERNETVIYPRMFLAASYLRVGRSDDASWEIEQGVTQRPATTISLLFNTMPFEKEENKMAFLEDLRQAGLPE